MIRGLCLVEREDKKSELNVFFYSFNRKSFLTFRIISLLIGLSSTNLRFSAGFLRWKGLFFCCFGGFLLLGHLC